MGSRPTTWARLCTNSAGSVMSGTSGVRAGGSSLAAGRSEITVGEVIRDFEGGAFICWNAWLRRACA